MADLTASVPGARSSAQIRADYLEIARRKRVYSAILVAIFAALMISGFMLADSRNAGGFWDGLHQIFDFPKLVIAEAWEKRANLPANIARYLPALIETLNIAAVATLIGAMLGTVLSMLSTRGLARWPRAIPLFRRLMDVMRAVPEIVIALILIFVLGGGPVPAMIAIAFHTSGALGKLFSEVNENASLKPVEGLASVGATWTQRMVLGVMPQVAPNYLSYALLRFEINIRASAILGFVGAGGIGYELKNSMSWGIGKFDEAAAIFLLLFLTIVGVDQLSSYFRNLLTHGRKKGVFL
ncbi:phosphonate ABC transporter, permease protein PhnE [Pseudooceanicola sp. HF7]|uniref:phosphonate ABC transporter, permease protein PhnE n=1 Tax=Pseudooceanicola sp. HF7 TaxID=2721560 RepID=UPI00142F7AF5|nr:phosphonate ABC transporter, permease protein PhnE [Pseudooceanicola sp. HF7]NIZ11205.1 phosphonate ABC transporter, permease protein PhnE [Pseudooceanicola sp. HF7]